MVRHDAGVVWTCDRCGLELTLPTGNTPPAAWRTLTWGRLDIEVEDEVRYDLCPECVATCRRVLEVSDEEAALQDLSIRALAEAHKVREGESAYQSLYRWVPDERRLDRFNRPLARRGS